MQNKKSLLLFLAFFFAQNLAFSQTYNDLECGLIIQTFDQFQNEIDVEFEILTPDGKTLTSTEHEEKFSTKSVWILPAGDYKIFGIDQSRDKTNFNFVLAELKKGQTKNVKIIFNANNAEILGEVSPTTWLVPNPIVQEKTLNPSYKLDEGGILLPIMTDNGTEDGFKIYFEDGKVLQDQEMGKIIKLKSGIYRIKIGEQQKGQGVEIDNIKVTNGKTTIVNPIWSSLIINIIDQTRNQLNETYEIYKLPELVKYRQGTGLEEGFGQKLRVWILPPGLYKIIKANEAPNTYQNFATIQLLSGELTQMTIIFDEEKNFIGSGILEVASSDVKLNKNWKIFRAIYGNAQLINQKDDLNKNSTTTITISLQTDINAKFEKDPFFFQSKLLLDESFTKEENFHLKLTRDEFRLKNIGIIRLTRNFLYLRELGIYSRFYVTNKIFNQYEDFTTLKNIRKVDGNREVIELNTERTKISPYLFPLRLEEGIGLNINVIKTINTNINIRGGFGFSQTFNKDTFTKNSSVDTLYTTIPNSKIRGFELSFLNELKPFSKLTINNEFNVILPFNKNKKKSYDWETQVNFKLIKNVSLDYTNRIKKQDADKKASFENILQLRFSLIF